jgi:RNA polymerase sigma-70 factor (ECF subfamily)
MTAPIHRLADARVDPVAESDARKTPSDGELVERARSGDRWAREALFRRYVAPLARLVTRLLARTDDADDVVQDTFAHALRDLDRLRDPAAFRHWLFRIAVNRAKKRGRRRRVERMLGLDSGVDDATLIQLASSSASSDELVELARIDAILARLPTDERIAWMLRRVEGETLEVVAELCGCSLATAKRRVEAVEVKLRAHRERGFQ